MRTRRVALCVALLVTMYGSWTELAQAQGSSRTEGLVKELTMLLDGAKLDSVAARHAGSQDVFVAALYFPGSQLLVVSAKYAAPPLMNEMIIQRRYRDAYIDLNVAVDPATKVFVEDLRVDGLHPTRAANEPYDIYTKGDDRFAFDGEWRKRKLSEDAYMKTFNEADAEYARMLESLIAELKKG